MDYKGCDGTMVCCEDELCVGYTVTRATPGAWNTRAPDPRVPVLIEALAQPGCTTCGGKSGWVARPVDCGGLRGLEIVACQCTGV